MSLSPIGLAEKRLIPDVLIRVGIRRLLRKRLGQEGVAPPADVEQQLAEALAKSPMTIHADAANDQHYEVPSEFYQLVLGPRLKYSCGYWDTPSTDLKASEEAMLELTCQRADLHDGQRILELGCGWGSLSLWMAEQYPSADITVLSNSTSQRQHIESVAKQRGFQRLRVITNDIADFDISEKFDRVVSVEMFEHVRNHQQLLSRIANWLHRDGRLFVHIFCHRDTPYLFETDGDENWMGRHFFTGGMMPSRNWLAQFNDAMHLEQTWEVNGQHYQRTSEAWLQQLDSKRHEALHLFRQHLDENEAAIQVQRWRIFFMACAELFGFQAGREWFVGHYRMARNN